MATNRQIKGDMKFSINWRIITFLDLGKTTNVYKYLELI